MFKALLATGRISNLPTVWSNVLLAHLLVMVSVKFHSPLLGISTPDFPFLQSILGCSLAASLFYVGGCFLGDGIDAHFDATHKQERPIPSGVIKRSTVLIIALTLIILGSITPFIAISNLAEKYSSYRHENITYLIIASIGLFTSILAYSWLHKKSPWFSLPLIGSCRFALILFGATYAVANIPLPITDESKYLLSFNKTNPLNFLTVTSATVIGLYTICFASVARTESSKKPFSYRNTIAFIMAFLPFLFLWGIAIENKINTWEEIKNSISILMEMNSFLILTIAYINYWIWFTASLIKLRNNNKGEFVSMSLAGFCLLDATIAALFGWQYLLIILALFALSLLLQKIAPAT